jgi:hypothetical protein
MEPTVNELKPINIRNIGISLLALGLASVSFADEMSVEAKIESAMSAAPARISADATIMDYDGTILREGTNEWICKPGGLAGSKAYPICNDPVFTAWADAVWNGKPFSTDVIGYSYMLAGGFSPDTKNPFAKKSEPTENSHHEGPHLMLVLPNPAMREGISSDPDDDGIFVIYADTPMELVIIPLGDVIEE